MTARQARGRCLPLCDWPEQDRTLWEQTLRPATDVLGITGHGSHWRPTTRRTLESSYGRWLAFLMDRNACLDDELPGLRVREGLLRAYIEELTSQVASATLAGRIRDLSIVIKCLDPTFDDARLLRVRQKLKSRAKPTSDKRMRLVSPGDLISLAIQLMERAEQDLALRQDWRACLYRDAVVILLLVFRPLRRSNLAELKLGQSLLEENGHFRIELDGSAMKNHQPYSAALPDVLTAPFQRYLDHYRPILLRGRVCDDLWISSRGHPLTDACIYGKLTSLTSKELSVAISPHLFRDIAVTDLGEQDPELVRLAQTLLHHADARTTETHYNHAREQHAVSRYQTVVAEYRMSLDVHPKP